MIMIGRYTLERFLLIAAFAAFLALDACYSYRAVPADRRFALGRSGSASEITGGRRSARYRVTVERVFALRISTAPAAAINNRAVDCARQGRYGEAEILLREALAEDPRNPAACNNLGIMCELAGNRNEAFRMYTEACRLEPGNKVFRNNFLTFSGHRE